MSKEPNVMTSSPIHINNLVEYKRTTWQHKTGDVYCPLDDTTGGSYCSKPDNLGINYIPEMSASDVTKAEQMETRETDSDWIAGLPDNLCSYKSNEAVKLGYRYTMTTEHVDYRTGWGGRDCDWYTDDLKGGYERQIKNRANHYGIYTTESTLQVRWKDLQEWIDPPEGYHFCGITFYKGDPSNPGSENMTSSLNSGLNFGYMPNSDYPGGYAPAGYNDPTGDSPMSPKMLGTGGGEYIGGAASALGSYSRNNILNLSVKGDDTPTGAQAYPGGYAPEGYDDPTDSYEVCGQTIQKITTCQDLPDYAVIQYCKDNPENGNDTLEKEGEEEEIQPDDPIEVDPIGEGIVGSGLGSIGSSLGGDQIDLLNIPSNLPVYDADGIYIKDDPYTSFDGLVITKDGVFYEPQVRISSITNSLKSVDTMEFTQFTKFDATPVCTEGDLVYGVIQGENKFIGHITGVNYKISGESQEITYRATGIRKNFENAAWKFNYKDRGVYTDTLLQELIEDAPSFYCRGIMGYIPSIDTVEFEFTNATIGRGIRYIFDSIGKYAWYLGPDKIFRVYNLENLPIKNVFVGKEGEKLSEHSEYNVVDLDLNYELSDRVTRVIVRGAWKKDAYGYPILDEDGNPSYEIYDTGWTGTAYTNFNIQNVKTLTHDKLVTYHQLETYAKKYIAPLKDAYLGGNVTVSGVDTDYKIGRAVGILNSNISYLENQRLVITNVRYNLDEKTTELTLTSDYWFGTNITKFYETLANKLEDLEEYSANLERIAADNAKMQYITGKIISAGEDAISISNINGSSSYIIDHNTTFMGATRETIGGYPAYTVHIKYMKYTSGVVAHSIDVQGLNNPYIGRF